MGHFDGMENQKELEIYFKKLVSAFISLSEDLLQAETQSQYEQEDICSNKENYLPQHFKPTEGRA